MSVNLKFNGLGYNDYLQADVKLYDNNCNLIYEGRTFDGEVSLYLEEDNCYKLYAYSCGRYINLWFYVSMKNSCYKFNFNNIEDNNVTFLLTDYYYDNLPIQKGELILWQR